MPRFIRWFSCSSAQSRHSRLGHWKALSFSNETKFSTPDSSLRAGQVETFSIWSFVSFSNPWIPFSFLHWLASNFSKDTNISRLCSSSSSLQDWMFSSWSFVRLQNPCIALSWEQPTNSSVMSVGGSSPTSTRSLQSSMCRCIRLGANPFRKGYVPYIRLV